MKLTHGIVSYPTAHSSCVEESALKWKHSSYRIDSDFSEGQQGEFSI